MKSSRSSSLVATDAYSSMLVGNPLGPRLSAFWEELRVAMAASRSQTRS